MDNLTSFAKIFLACLCSWFFISGVVTIIVSMYNSTFNKRRGSGNSRPNGYFWWAK